MFPISFTQAKETQSEFVRKVARLVFGACTALGVVTLFSACAPSFRGEVWQAQSPTGNDSVGTLVLVGEYSPKSKQQLEGLLQEFGGQGRVLNESHGFFEIHGVPQDKIQNIFPAAIVEPNQYFHNLVPVTQRMSNVELIALAQKQSGVDFDKCQQATEAPAAIINVDEGQDVLKGLVFRGARLRLNDRGSRAHEKHPSQLRRAWILIPPSDSNLGEMVHPEAQFEVTPDALGGYQLGLVVQDDRDVCGMKVLDFVVTANVPYEGLKPVRERTHDDLLKFAQLLQVSAPQAWQRSQGEGATIAIVDTGVFYNHVDLAANILVNDKEIPGNNIDDDKNGFVDDVVGWDFANSDAFPYDDEGHGTHVAGLAASAVTGVAPKAKILAVKAMNGFGGGDVGSVGAALMYAVDRGANIVNCSFGSPSKVFLSLNKAFEYARSKGVIMMVAAGNGDNAGRGYNIDRQPIYPASFNLDNMLTVASVDGSGQLTPYSNFGMKTVRIAAPGGTSEKRLWSTNYDSVKGELYAAMIGTSMATPVAAGVIALAKSKTNLSVPELLALTEQAGEVKSVLQNRVRSSRVLSAEALLK